MGIDLNKVESYVVHLKNRKDREENMIKELNSFVDNWEVFDAIKMNPGYKGTSESFKSIIRDAKDKGLDQVLVFEDDVRFTSKKSKIKFQNAIDSLPEKWDVLLGGVYTMSKPRKINKINKHLVKVGDFSSLHCILINKSAYDKILEHDPNTVKHLDRYLGKLSREDKLKTYLTYPMVAIQYNTYSDNVNKSVNYNKLLDKFELFDFKVKHGRRRY